jgi:FdhD protein
MRHAGALDLPRTQVCGDAFTQGLRTAAEEAAVALVYNGSTQAVLMATPTDLEDLAVGFSLTEGLIEGPADVAELDIVSQGDGVELRMWLSGERAAAFGARRRAMLGPTGCGLCGVESLAEAVRAPRHVTSDTAFTPDDVRNAMLSLGGLPLGSATRAVHAAGFWRPREGLVAVREDVGRHNALDKLAGALAREGQSGGDGIIVLTSRVSVEMVQKAARIGAPVVAAISAPTALAVRTARAAGLTLVAVARDDGFEVFTDPGRIGLPGDAGARAVCSSR